MTVGSRTAVLVCQARAVAHGRLAPGRFGDPTASVLLRGDELDAVQAVRSGTPPRDRTPRKDFEVLRDVAEAMVARTVAIDDAARTRATPQVVILGAGLDGRAWRMTELAQTSVFEVDHPSSQRDKQHRIAALPPPPGPVIFVPVDFTVDRLDDALAEAGHLADQPTTWIWEGVVPYLTQGQTADTVRRLAGCSAPGSRLIVHYQSSTLAATLGRAVARATRILSRRPDPLAHEPWRSTWTPTTMRNLLNKHRFDTTTDTDLLAIAKTLAMPTHNPRYLRSAHILIADRQAT